MKNIKPQASPKFFTVIFCILSFALFFSNLASAQDADKLTALTKQIMEAKDKTELFTCFEGAANLYFGENKYEEYIQFLKSVSQKKKELEAFTDYYTALSRYNQLKSLEDTKNWDSYFSNGNAFREELVSSLEKAIANTGGDDLVNLYARLLFWRFHNDQKDASGDKALESLMAGALEFSQKNANITVIKDVADQLMSSGAKLKARELYKIYCAELISPQTQDEELPAAAANFYAEGNLDLSEDIYDAYITRLANAGSKEKLIPLLAELAEKFSYKDKGVSDSGYAEKIFKKIEEAGGKDALDERLLYLRARNLEKNKDYPQAADVYSALEGRFAQSPHADEIDYKLGIIAAYVSRDIEKGKAYFKKLAEKETVTPQVVSGLYQLGLLEQWAGNFEPAKSRYNDLIEKSGGNFSETQKLAKARLKEISEGKEIEYNLKVFLDASLKENSLSIGVNSLSLTAAPYLAQASEEIKIDSQSHASESGCLAVEIQYLWSGQIGDASPTAEQPSFSAKYAQAGTKEVNLVVVSPSGIIGRSIVMVDVE